MIRIDVLTTTRAEYGLLRPLLAKLKKDDFFKVRLLVSGTHFSDSYGSTYKEILNDGNSLDYSFRILSGKEGVEGTIETMSCAIKKFGHYFATDAPDFLLVDGDRYETLAICLAAYSCRVPIIHVGGGDVTEGAMDDAYRHCITKLAYLHFPTNEVYAARIRQLGEASERICNVGSLSIDNILQTEFLSVDELSESLGVQLKKPFAVATYHPVTLESQSSESQIISLLEACYKFNDMQFIFTGSNADDGGNRINEIILDFIENKDNFYFVKSLGAKRYISALHHCEFVIGNSSSGITEAPSLHIPTINIGDRQKGRIQALSTINCLPNKRAICEAICKARTIEFKKNCKLVVNPNGDGHASEKITLFIKQYLNRNSVDLMKKFIDL